MIQEIAFGSSHYRDTLRFRNRHLREPLGLVLSEADIAGEDQQWHFVALDAGEVVGTVLLKPLTGGVANREPALPTRALISR